MPDRDDLEVIGTWAVRLAGVIVLLVGGALGLGVAVRTFQWVVAGE